ncbi:hypothetical protein DHEL01_v208033, partial [Diaporthe helianthi]
MRTACASLPAPTGSALPPSAPHTTRREASAVAAASQPTSWWAIPRPTASYAADAPSSPPASSQPTPSATSTRHTPTSRPTHSPSLPCEAPARISSNSSRDSRAKPPGYRYMSGYPWAA